MNGYYRYLFCKSYKYSNVIGYFPLRDCIHCLISSEPTEHKYAPVAKSDLQFNFGQSRNKLPSFTIFVQHNEHNNYRLDAAPYPCALVAATRTELSEARSYFLFALSFETWTNPSSKDSCFLRIGKIDTERGEQSIVKR